MTDRYFSFDHRLGIYIPNLHKSWELYDSITQHELLFQWEQIRGGIPDRIKVIENSINEKQERLNIEEDFHVSCKLNSEIAELASAINDLWLLYRMNQEITKNHR